ncbi:MAG: TOBE domain-containing protein [Gaiellales bacterium]
MEDTFDDRVGIGAAASALGVSVDTLRRWERTGRAHFDRDEAGRRTLPSAELARLLRERNPSARQSARNHLDGTVVAVQVDGVMAQVELACGPYRVVSLMSREAAEELGLRPGVAATASIKATLVVVERR